MQNENLTNLIKSELFIKINKNLNNFLLKSQKFSHERFQKNGII